MDPAPTRLALAHGEVDLERRRAVVRGVELRLTTTEAGLLAYLAAHPGRAVPRDELLKEVWGYADGAVSRTVDVTVRRLRAKIEADSAFPTHLLSVHGVGYTFVPLPAAETPAPAPTPPPAPVPEHGADDTIGRDAARAEAWDALAAGARPLTLAGPAGVGKTRLARTLVQEARAAGRPAWFVDLVAAETAADVAVAVASTVGASQATDDAIARVIGAPGTLLVLDNFEQLPPDAAERVGAWAKAAPDAAFVVTSRRPLGLSGEETLRIDPLPAEDAVALFRRRALRVRADVGLEDVDALRGIVTRLDGLPLAIELAAARLRALSVEELSDRLALSFLRDPSPANARRATLARALDGSWALLDDEARAALVALSVLPGASFVAVAERLLALVGIEDPLGALEVLVDHSLVRVEEGPKGTDAARFVPFVVVAEYAAARRDAEGAAAAVKAWAEALAAQLEEWSAGMNGPDGHRALLRVLGETDNVLALLQRHAEAAGADALRVAAAHAEATNAAGGHPSEVAVVDRAVALAGALGDDAARARFLSRRVFVYDRAGRVDDACADADAIALLAAASPALHLHHVRAQLGRAGALRRAERPREALAALDALVLPDDLPASFHCYRHNERGLVLVRLGELSEAAGDFERSFAIAEKAGDLRRADAALDHLALARVEEGRGAEVEALVRDAVARRRATAGDTLVSPLWYALGAIALEAGRLDEARACFLAEQEAGRARGRASAIAAGYANVALVDLRAGDAVAAVASFRAALDRLAHAGARLVPAAPLAGLVVARILAGEKGVALDPGAVSSTDTPVDIAILALAEATVAFAAGEEGAAPRLDAALESPLVRRNLDLRELARHVAVWRAGRR